MFFNKKITMLRRIHDTKGCRPYSFFYLVFLNNPHDSGLNIKEILSVYLLNALYVENESVEINDMSTNASSNIHHSLFVCLCFSRFVLSKMVFHFQSE